MLLRFFLIIILGTLLVGCSTLVGKHNYFKQRETAYLKANEAPSLQLPAGMSRTNIGDDYIIPPVPGPIPTQPVNIIPPGSLAAHQNAR